MAHYARGVACRNGQDTEANAELDYEAAQPVPRPTTSPPSTSRRTRRQEIAARRG
jgi:hypothetical protein